MQERSTRTTASVGCFSTGSGTSSTRTSPAPYMSVARTSVPFSGGWAARGPETRHAGGVGRSGSVGGGRRGALLLVVRLLILINGRRPAREQGERVRASASDGFGGVDEQGQAGVGGELQRLVGEVEVADDRVAQPLERRCGGTARRGPPSGCGTPRCAWRARRRGRSGRGRRGCAPPRRAARPRCRWRSAPSRRRSPGPRVEEGEPGRVGRPDAGRRTRRVQRAAEPVGRQDVGRPLRTQAGASASRRARAARRAGPAAAPAGAAVRGSRFAARARSNRCARSASSSCSARAMPSSTLSDAPCRFPRSSRV